MKPSIEKLKSVLIAASLTICAELASGCQPTKVTPVSRGKVMYMTNCVVCHNADPNLSGSQGPPIAGSSRELVEARVLHLSYPPGYKPKRTTHAMRAIPMLAPEIGNITAFLDDAAKKHNGASSP